MSDPVTHYLTTREFADLLRIGERKVYDLVATNSVPHTKATGKLLFPRQEVYRWLASQTKSDPDLGDRPPVICGSHDPLLDWALRQSRCGLAALFDGSSDGLHRFEAREGVAAGIHIRNVLGDGWNTEAVADRFGAVDCVLVEWAKRQRGLIIRPGNNAVGGLADLKGLRVMARQQGSGTQSLFESLIRDHQMDLSDFEIAGVAGTETEAATAVLDGTADVCLGLASIARRFNLAFVPVCEERFDLLVDRKGWFDAPFASFWKFCQSTEFAAAANAHAGYDISGMGTVHFNSA